MKKVIIFYALFFLIPKISLASWVEKPENIRTYFQDSVPHLNKYGKIQNQYNADSFFLLGLYWTDIGPVPDEEGIPRGSAWLKKNLGNNIADTTYSYNTLPDVKAAGFNTVYPAFHQWPFLNRYELDLIASYGLKTFPDLSYEAPAMISAGTDQEERVWANTIFVNSYGHEMETIKSPKVITDNQWHHVAATTLDGNLWHFYLDSEKQGEKALNLDIQKSGKIRLGSLSIIPGILRYNGQIDKFKVYNFGMNQDQINSEKNGENLNPVKSWSFEGKTFAKKADAIELSDENLPSGKAPMTITLQFKTSATFNSVFEPTKDNLANAILLMYGKEELGKGLAIAISNRSYHINSFKNVMAGLKNHPAIIGWHLFDEAPEHNWGWGTEPMTEAKWNIIHDAIKSVDDRMVFANYAPLPAKNADCYRSPDGKPVRYSDISSFDIYDDFYADGTLPGAPVPNLAKTYMDKGCTVPIMGIYRAFKYSHWNEPVSPERIRGEMWGGIINGLTMLMAYIQHNTFTNGGGPWNQVVNPNDSHVNTVINRDMWEIISRTNKEIEANKSIIFAKTARDAYKIFIDDSLAGTAVQAMLKDKGEENIRYLITGNLGLTPTRTKFSFVQNIARITPLVSDSPTFTISNNEFSADFTPYGIGIYKIEFNQKADINTFRQIIFTADIFKYAETVANFGF